MSYPDENTVRISEAESGNLNTEKSRRAPKTRVLSQLRIPRTNACLERLDFMIPSTGRQAILVNIEENGNQIKALFCGGHTTPAYQDDAPVTNRAFIISLDVNQKQVSAIQEIPGMKVKRWGHRASILHNGKVFIAGGGDDSRCELFSPGTSEFEYCGKLNHARSGHEQELLANGKVIIIGGYAKGENKKGTVQSIECFNPAADEIKEVANLEFGRAAHRIALINNEIYVIGGSSSTKVEKFNATSMAVEDSGITLPIPLKDFGLHVEGNKIYLIGGTNAESKISSNAIYELDITSKKVRELKCKLSVAREDLLVISSPDKNQIMAVSGEIKDQDPKIDGEKTGVVELIDLGLETTKKIISRNVFRDDARSIEVAPGTHFIAGGTIDKQDTFCQGGHILSFH